MSYFRNPYREPFHISPGRLNGQKIEGRGFNTVDAAERYYRDILATLPAGYVYDPIEDFYPRRSYRVCPKCGGLDTIFVSKLSTDGRAWTCKACGYRLRFIDNRNDLQHLAAELGVMPDWHEPDEMNVTIRFVGTHFDNAGSSPGGFGESPDRNIEYQIVVQKDGEDVAVVNVATLFAIAAGR